MIWKWTVFKFEISQINSNGEIVVYTVLNQVEKEL